MSRAMQAAGLRAMELAAAAFGAGADSVVMAGRALGLLPDLDTIAPMLGTRCRVGGFWNLPLTWYWLASTCALLGPEAALIGINGATDGLDVAWMLLAGASAVGHASKVMLCCWAAIASAVAELEDDCSATGISAADRGYRSAGSYEYDCCAAGCGCAVCKAR